MQADRPARLADVDALARALPQVEVVRTATGHNTYQVHGKSFVFFRSPRPDAVDPVTGERFADVIVLWVAAEEDKLALIQDETSPFFTTPHFDDHLSVLLRGSRIAEVSYRELHEVVQDAWLARAPRRLAKAWLTADDLIRPQAGSLRATGP